MENEDEKKSVVLESENSKFTWQSSKITRSFHSVFGNTFEEYVIFFRGLIWLIAVAFCTYFMIYQLQQCLDKLKSPPVQTQTQIKMKEYMDYPAITLCYKNKDGQGYDESLLQVRLNLFFRNVITRVFVKRSISGSTVIGSAIRRENIRTKSGPILIFPLIPWNSFGNVPLTAFSPSIEFPQPTV